MDQQTRSKLMRCLDAVEDAMIALAEYRDAPGRTTAEIIRCNQQWEKCDALYTALTRELRRKHE